MERFRLTDDQVRSWRAHQAVKILAMTPAEQRAYYEAQEADALREALSDEVWGKA